MLESVCGPQNCGKSLILTKKAFGAFLEGRKIYSNIYLAFPHTRINKDWLLDIAEKGASFNKKIMIVLDEFWIWFDSYDSFHASKTISYLFNQSSKNDIDILVTAQDNSQNPRRIRKNLHKLTICERVLVIDGEIYKVESEDRILPENLWDQQYIYVFEMKKSGNVGFSRLTPSAEYLVPAKPYFKLFNTREKIKRVVKNG